MLHNAEMPITLSLHTKHVNSVLATNDFHRSPSYRECFHLISKALIFMAPLWNLRSDMLFAEFYSELIVVNYIIGSVLLIIHLCNIVRRFIPERMLNKNKFLTIIFRGSG